MFIFELYNVVDSKKIKGCKFLKEIYRKFTSRSYSYFFKFTNFVVFEKPHSLIKKANILNMEGNRK